MESETIRYNAKEGVVVITLNRPDALNALSEEMRDSLKEALLKAANDETVRVVILTGEGRAFCAGADLKRFKTDYEHFERTGEPSRFYDASLPRVLAFYPKPILAAVNGPAVGVGMTMSLACDIRLGSESASFSCPFTRIGLTPEFGSAYFLPRLVGHSKAAEWVLTSRMIKAPEALSTGLISEIISPDVDLLDETRKIALAIAAMPEAAILSAKKLLRQAMDLSLSETLEEETRVFQNCQKEHSHYVAVNRVMEQIRGK
jgi:2-(1,2-epoxy-1,2-dihydrophenyl)acetyl-CoA isomerase